MGIVVATYLGPIGSMFGASCPLPRKMGGLAKREQILEFLSRAPEVLSTKFRVSHV